MVPHSSTPGPGPRELSAESALALRDAVRRVVARPAAPGDGLAAAEGALREAVTAVVTEARERQMRPEELITSFKALLDSIPEVHEAGGRVEETRLRERLVTLCIKAYYAPRGGGSAETSGGA